MTLSGSFRAMAMAMVIIAMVMARFSLSAAVSGTASAPETALLTEQAEIVMGSWRTDDIPQMRVILNHFEARHPDIRVIFDPTPAAEYDAVLQAQLEAGSGPDLFYLRSFSVSRALFNKGFIAPLDGLPGLKNQFTPEMLAPWTSTTGTVYGVPFIATAHGIYYNQDLFKQLNLAPPRTWGALMDHARTIRSHGIIPFANASGDPWTVIEIMFCNLVPGFIGGYEGRMAYLNGDRCFNDDAMVNALQALARTAPFLPENHHLIKYQDSLHLFIQGRAAMWMGGSWDIPYFESEGTDFSWDVFVTPPPEGKTPVMTFHLDAGMGMNPKTSSSAAVRTFLSWLTRPETGRLMANTLPGFFPMHRELVMPESEQHKSPTSTNVKPLLDNAHAQRFLDLKKQLNTDIRLPWEALRQGTPDGYTVIREAAMATLNGQWSPKAAADHIQDELSGWFSPAAGCREP